MAPSAESSLVGAGPPPTTSKTTPKRRRSSLTSSLSRKTIAFAVNWERSIVDRYWTNPTPPPLPPVKAAVVVAPVPESTKFDFDASSKARHQRTTRRSSRARAASIVQQQPSLTPPSRVVTIASDTPSQNTSNGNSVVVVPPEDESEEQHRRGQRPSQATIGPLTQAGYLPRSVSTDNTSAIVKIEEAPTSSSYSSSESSFSSSNGGDISSAAASPSQRNSTSALDQHIPLANFVRSRVRYDMEMVPAVQPNLEGSVVYFPQNRKEWEESVSELTAVCTSAVSRKQPLVGQGGKATPMIPPLSKEYIRDRIDIDDPLRGYQIRSSQGGWLQGYLLWTNFTTWTHFFSWDSLHEKSGLPQQAKSVGALQDIDGSLAKELQALPRHGDPSETGIVFPNVAEIALVGGLRCGGTLLRMALEDIRRNPQYKYVALQATDGSKKFYERFGFKRVGAICKYGTTVSQSGMKSHSLVMPTVDTPLSGYRHWTHANEAPESLNLHGGPSYMMCLKLNDSVPKTNLFDYIQPFIVEEKPSIKSLGSASTPAPKSSLLYNPRNGKGKSPIPKGRIFPVAGGKRVYDDGLQQPLGATIPAGIGSANKRRKISITDENMAPSFSAQASGLKRKPAKVTPRTPKKISSSSSSRLSSPPPAPSLANPKPMHRPVEPTGKLQKVDRAVLCKQKVKSYPRDRAHFYNKVVQPRSGEASFFFVLHYSEAKQELTLVPMKATGILSGKRQGRPRFQCLVQETSANWLTAQPCGKFNPVPAFMVMKTPIVAQEAWDILCAKV